MPLPKPREGETKQQYIARCNRFVRKEIQAGRSRPRTNEQINAMCYAQYEQKHLQFREVTLHAHPEFKALGNALLLEGDLLKPGTWIGLDGVPTRYSKEFIDLVKESIVGKPIRFAHKISPGPLTPEIPKGETVGFWTKVLRDGKLRVRGYVFFPEAVKYLKANPNIGLSMEADVITSFNHSLGVEEAEHGTLTGGVLIEDPACPTCRVTSTREVNLETRQKKRDALSETNDTTGSEELLEFITDEEKKKNLAVTRGAFFDWIEEQLKKAGAPEDIIPKVIAVLKKAIKTPYPYPAPGGKEEETFLEFLENLENIEAKDLSAYTDFIGKCVKGGKTMKACALEWKEKQKATQKPLEDLTPKERELSEQLASTKAELEATKKLVSMQLQEDLRKLEGDIKQYDKDFDVTKFLENVECPITKKKMLQKYFAVLKKHAKPIKLQIGDDAARERVSEIVKGMFGENMTFEKLFELPEKKGD